MRVLIRSLRTRVFSVAALLMCGGLQPLAAQATPAVERPISFDSVGRVSVLTPALVRRLALAAPAWPVAGDFREARLYATGADDFVLSVARVDGTVARYTLSNTETSRLRQQVEGGLIAARGRMDDRDATRGAGVELSQPAGNAFVRNQTLLGLTAYGPATAAVLSDAGGGAAAGGYFLAAGSAFFIAANTIRNREVTVAQNKLSSHAGIRGAVAGAGAAAILRRSGGPGYGAPILAGALAGTIGGFRGARSMSDGEAASAGLMADLSALTTLGVGGALGAFEREQVVVNEFGAIEERLGNGGRVAIGAAIATGLGGYAWGSRYAKRADYNVTSGDATVAFTGAQIGAVFASALPGDGVGSRTMFGVATGGLLAGFALTDRLLVRTADRTAADGTLAQLGAFAGALMGGGAAALTESGRQASLGFITVGATLGLVAADRLIAPGPDAGPLRGVMQTSVHTSDARVTVSVMPLVTALAAQSRAPARQLAYRPTVVTNVPVLRVLW